MLYKNKNSVLSVLKEYYSIDFLKNLEIFSEKLSNTEEEIWHVWSFRFNLLIRKNNCQKKALGINIKRIFRILHSLRKKKIAPRPVFINNNWIFIEWIFGKNITLVDWKKIIVNGILASNLAYLHKQTYSGYSINFKKYLTLYWNNIDVSRNTPSWIKLQKKFLYKKTPRIFKKSLLHMDLHNENIIFLNDHSLSFIDWEYSGDGDIALELAALFYNGKIDKVIQQKFLIDYVQCMPGINIQELHSCIDSWYPWISYLTFLWYEARWNQTKNNNFITLACPFRYFFRIDK